MRATVGSLKSTLTKLPLVRHFFDLHHDGSGVGRTIAREASPVNDRIGHSAIDRDEAPDVHEKPSLRELPTSHEDHSSPFRWSIVIPAYNEASRLPTYLAEVIAYFAHRADRYEVLVVDDGSVDGTANVVRSMAAVHPAIRLVDLPINRGKGNAVRVGMLRARGQFRLMADADGATPIAEIARLEAALRANGDLAIGSRALRDDSVVRCTLPHRRWSGAVFNVAVHCLGVHNIHHTQCGFKLFRGDVADTLFSALQTDGFGFDVELLLRAHGMGYRVVEVPVNWADQPGSKVRVITDGPRMLWQIAQYWWRARRRTPVVAPFNSSDTKTARAGRRRETA